MIYYRDDYTDFIMHHNTTLPRYRFLARKALSHYLGDLYNPEKLDPQIELDFRSFINTCVHIKTQNKVAYDWAFIQNWFKASLKEAGFSLMYDLEVIEAGYHQGMYNLKSKHHA